MEDTLKIYAYSDAERSTELGVFECYVSPLSIKMNRNNRFGRLNTINGTIPLTAFSNGGTNSLELTIVLDGTGAYAVKDDEPYKVVDQLNDLMKYTVLYDGSIHQPPFLKVVWGTIPVFVCRAQDLDVDYKTFNSEGVPVQADVKLPTRNPLIYFTNILLWIMKHCHQSLIGIIMIQAISIELRRKMD
jgi:hypothetical protein